MQSDVLFSIQGKFSLKDICHEIFCLRFFSWIIFPQATENNIRIISQIKVDHRYQRQRWQIIGTVSDCLHLKGNLKGKNYLYVISTIERCPNKIIKNLLIEDFFPFPPVSKTSVAVTCEYLSEFSQKFETALMGYSRAWGKLIHEKKPEVENLVALSL